MIKDDQFVGCIQKSIITINKKNQGLIIVKMSQLFDRREKKKIEDDQKLLGLNFRRKWRKGGYEGS